MKKAKRPFLSLVMIVKNEAEILDETLAQYEGVVDEWIVVDTGSTDNTRDIIRKYCRRVHEIPFTNFVETKNRALALATGEWILFSDADERPIANLMELRNFIRRRQNDIDAVATHIVEGPSPYDVAVRYARIRAFRNNGMYQFFGPGVHESLPAVGRIVMLSDVEVYHDHAHRTAESFAARNELYIETLQAHLAQEPQDPRAMFYLARTYHDKGALSLARAWFAKYLNLNTNARDERWHAAFEMGRVAMKEGEYGAALAAFDFALSIDNRRAEAVVQKAELYRRLGDYAAALPLYEQALTMTPPEDVILFRFDTAYGEEPARALLDIYWKLGMYDKAVGLLKTMLRTYTGDPSLLKLTPMLRKERLTLFFALGATPEPVSGTLLQDGGMGGVETSYVQLAEAMARQGHLCFVFCNTAAMHTVRDVVYVPYQELSAYNTIEPDAVISSRWFNLPWSIPVGKKIAWLQDNFFQDHSRPDFRTKADALVVSSPWHKALTLQYGEATLQPHTVYVIPLAVDHAFYTQAVTRHPHRVIYSSNPNRGLQYLADMWPRIVAAVPDAELIVTYGWEGLLTWRDDPAWQQTQNDFRTRLQAQLAPYNVTFTGRLPKRELARMQLSAAVCAYPTDFAETYCLTAREMSLAGTPLVSTALAALTTTAAPTDLLLAGHPSLPDYQDVFVAEVVRLLTDTAVRDELGAAAQTWAQAEPTWDDVATAWADLIRRDANAK